MTAPIKRVLTEYASHANTIADTFRAAFAKTKVGDFTVVMTAPADSTKGGLLALQHVTLQPPSGMALVVGTLNAKDKRAELRSHSFVAEIHRERFKKELPFDEATYKEFLEKAEAVIGAFGVEVAVTDAPRDRAPSFADDKEKTSTTSEPARPNVTLWLVVLALAIAFAGGGLWFAFKRF